METFVQEIQSATDFVRQLFADQHIHLDYSPQSVVYLDALFEKEFNRGIPANAAGTFAQYQGLIMTGVSGYIARVILQNTKNVQLGFEENDEHWCINFSLEGENGMKFLPGHQVLKRAYCDEGSQLYTYVLETINFLKEPKAAVYPLAVANHLLTWKEKVKGANDWWRVW